MHDTVLAHDTIVFCDTIRVGGTVYVHITGKTGVRTAISEVPLSLSPAADGAGDLFYINGLAPDKEFTVHATSGALIYRGIRQPVHLPGVSLFIVGQGGRFWKVGK